MGRGVHNRENEEPSDPPRCIRGSDCPVVILPDAHRGFERGAKKGVGVRKTVLLVAALLAVVAGLVLTGCAQGADSAEDQPGREPDTSARADRTTPEMAPEETTERAAKGKRTRCEGMTAMHAFDVTDDRKLVGFADNVFVGHVAERVGTVGSTDSNLPGIVSTRFSVEVLENVKGNLQGVVTVEQDGGYDPTQGCVMLMENDPLLKPGQEILFLTRYDERHRLHQITSSGYGDVRVRNRTHRDALVRRFEEATKDQVDPTRQR